MYDESTVQQFTPQQGSQSGTTWSGVVDFRHPTRPGFVQFRRLPMFESGGGRPGFHGRFPLRDWQEMYRRENKAQFAFNEAT